MVSSSSHIVTEEAATAVIASWHEASNARRRTATEVLRCPALGTIRRRVCASNGTRGSSGRAPPANPPAGPRCALDPPPRGHRRRPRRVHRHRWRAEVPTEMLPDFELGAESALPGPRTSRLPHPTYRRRSVRVRLLPPRARSNPRSPGGGDARGTGADSRGWALTPPSDALVYPNATAECRRCCRRHFAIQGPPVHSQRSRTSPSRGPIPSAYSAG